MAKIDLLSAAKVRSVKKPGYYLDGRGLYLQVRGETSKSWLLKYSIDKRPRAMGLGSAFDFSLAEAREERDSLRKLIKRGVDPLEQKAADKQAAKVEAARAITFRAAADRFIASKRKGWKNKKHADQWLATLKTYAYPVIGDLPVQSVDTGLVMKILDPIWSTKTETASRVRGRIESVINSAKAYGEFIGENPARWKGNLEATLAKTSDVATKKNQPALSYAEMPAFLQELRSREGIAAAAMEFLILTAARTGEVLGATWDEFDLRKSVWTIPAERMKGGKEHQVPLSPPAVAVLERMSELQTGEFVFFGQSSGRSLSNMALLVLLRRMKRTDITSHGFRSTFRTWAGDETNFPREVIEKALAHLVGDETERAYDRGDLFDKRRKLMDAWGAFATREPSADVLPFAPLATAN